MTFSPSSKDGDVSEEATGDGGKEVVEAESGQRDPGGGGGGVSPLFGYGGAAGGLKP